MHSSFTHSQHFSGTVPPSKSSSKCFQPTCTSTVASTISLIKSCLLLRRSKSPFPQERQRLSERPKNARMLAWELCLPGVLPHNYYHPSVLHPSFHYTTTTTTITFHSTTTTGANARRRAFCIGSLFLCVVIFLWDLFLCHPCCFRSAEDENAVSNTLLLVPTDCCMLACMHSCLLASGKQ